MRPRDLQQRRATQLTCKSCGRTLPVECFERFPTGTYRHICSDCKYVRYTVPAMYRLRLRSLNSEL